jgi:hypothetical protein
LRPDHHHYIFNKYSKGRLEIPGGEGVQKVLGMNFFQTICLCRAFLNVQSLQEFFSRLHLHCQLMKWPVFHTTKNDAMTVINSSSSKHLYFLFIVQITVIYNTKS